MPRVSQVHLVATPAFPERRWTRHSGRPGGYLGARLRRSSRPPAALPTRRAVDRTEPPRCCPQRPTRYSLPPRSRPALGCGTRPRAAFGPISGSRCRPPVPARSAAVAPMGRSQRLAGGSQNRPGSRGRRRIRLTSKVFSRRSPSSSSAAPSKTCAGRARPPDRANLHPRAPASHEFVPPRVSRDCLRDTCATVSSNSRRSRKRQRSVVATRVLEGIARQPRPRTS